MRNTLMIVLVLPFAAIVAPNARADNLTYTETATITGTLDGVSFTNAPLTITLTANTSGIVNPAPGIFELDGPATVSLVGVGSGTLAGTPGVFAAQVPLGVRAGFLDSGIGVLFIFDSGGAAFGDYDLSTSIGPVTDPSLFNSNVFFLTTFGSLNITDSSNATFTAVDNTTAIAPEPSSIPLLASGLLAMGIIRLRMRHYRQRRHFSA